MSIISEISGRALPLRGDDLDTDRIMPARFLRVVTFEGLERHLFEDDRAADPSHAFNSPRYRGATVLVVNSNFGCGSSREHAVWALQGAGFRAVVSTRFADIFRGNALKNGLLPVEVDARTHARVLALVERDPSAKLTVDLEAQSLTLPDGTSVRFPVDSFSRHCLLNGIDELGYIQSFDSKIKAYEATHR